jgi:transposase
MTTREERGRAIAESQRLTRKGKFWWVPSQSSETKYCVIPDSEQPSCSCPDHEAGFKCKHIYAVEIIISQTVEMDYETYKETRTQSVTVKTTAERKTYQQADWPSYNAAQVRENEHFHELLVDLCSTLPETPRKPGKGRKPLSYRDGLFSAILKVYSLMSARRFSGELESARDRGFIDQLPHFNTVLGVFDNPIMTPFLKGMIEASALPLRAVEIDFATDSTGFSTQKYASWFDFKYNKTRTEAKWVKAHFTTGVKTNVVTACHIEDQDAADSPQLPALTAKTAESFVIKEMSADKAYASAENFKAVESHGGQFFPMFKVNTTGGIGGSFEKAFHYFSLNKEEYLQHYHKRSNVETTVSMVKRKFGDSVKAKNELAQKNEVYAKFVCHNICVLIQEMYVQGIEPILCPNRREPNDPQLRILRFPTG